MPKKSNPKRDAAKAARLAAWEALDNAKKTEELAKLRAKLSGKGNRSKRKRASRRLRGKGAYDMGDGPMGLIPRGLGAAYSWLRGQGAESGWNSGGKISKMLGMGAYSGVPWESTGSNITSVSASPGISTRPDGICVSKEEFLGTVVSTQGYAVQSYALNPGLSATFRWCSGIARNFQNYAIKQLLVRFESQLTNAVASFESMGTMMICAKTNAAAPPPADQAEFEQTEFATVVRPNLSVTAPIEMNPRQGAGGVKNIRTGVIGASTSINDYDSGNIFVATAGMPSDGVSIGRLYLYYVLELFNPVLNTLSSGECQYVQTTAGEGGNVSTPFGKGDQPVVKHEDTFGTTGVTWITVEIPATDAKAISPEPNTGYLYVGIKFPAGTRGTFVLENELIGTSGSGTPGRINWTMSNCVESGYNFYILGGGGLTYDIIPNNSASKCIQRTCFTIVDPSQQSSIQYLSGGANWPTAVTAYCTRVYEVIPNVVTSVPPRLSPADFEQLAELLRARLQPNFDEEKFESVSVASAASSASKPGQSAWKVRL